MTITGKQTETAIAASETSCEVIDLKLQKHLKKNFTNLLSLLQPDNQPVVVAHACNLNTREAEVHVGYIVSSRQAWTT